MSTKEVDKFIEELWNKRVEDWVDRKIQKLDSRDNITKEK